MKGFQALGIETIDVVRGAVIETVDWYDQMANAILHSQNGDGSWPDSNYGDIWLNTCWALLTIDAAAPPALALYPVFDTNPLNTSHTVTALYDIAGEPQPDAQIKFEIVSGPNAGETGSDATGSNGEAGFTYDGLDIGTDTIIASVDIDGDGVADLFSNPVTKAWISPGDRISGVSIWSTLLGAAALITVAVVLMRRKLVCDL